MTGQIIYWIGEGALISAVLLVLIMVIHGIREHMNKKANELPPMAPASGNLFRHEETGNPYDFHSSYFVNKR